MAEKLTLSLLDVLKLHEGLAALDGVATGDGKVQRFDFDEGLTWNIAKDVRLVAAEKETYELARASLGTKHGIVNGMKLTADNAAAAAAFMEADEKLKAKRVELTGILRLPRTALQKAGVKIPGILANLYPIVDDK